MTAARSVTGAGWASAARWMGLVLRGGSDFRCEEGGTPAGTRMNVPLEGGWAAAARKMSAAVSKEKVDAGSQTHGIFRPRAGLVGVSGLLGWRIERLCGRVTRARDDHLSGQCGLADRSCAQGLLVDPYLSEFGPAPDENDPDPILVPDQAQIDARIHRADYILITHGHPDHMLDAPYISNKTGAVIICTGSHANIARAYGVPEDRLIVVLGGEDYQFEGFSLRIMPSLHSPLFGKRYNNDPQYNGNTPAGLKAPLHASAYVEGGSLAYLLRIGGHRIFIHGSMNYIENEIQNLRPDIAMIGANKSRTENYDYAGRIMRALGNPPIVLPQHWVHGAPISAESLENVRQFAAEIKAASPATRVVIPEYFKAMQFR
jgi:L-ascorbate metabolism protein UlaG (beta-lactamase superfamily)